MKKHVATSLFKFLNETKLFKGSIKDIKNEIENFYNNDKHDQKMFDAAKQFGKKSIENSVFKDRITMYIYHSFKDMGSNLKKEDIELSFYDKEKVFLGFVPDGTFKQFGKTGRSVSLRKYNIVVFEKGSYNNNEGWISHEIGHVVSWRDYRDNPKIENKFSNELIFNPETCFGCDHYPNVICEYIPFTYQIKDLLINNSPEICIRLMMNDYENSKPGDVLTLKSYEQVFINLLKLIKNVDIKNKYT